MKKLMTSLLVSGLVLTGVSAGHHAEAASGNTMQTVQQITQGDQSLENVKAIIEEGGSSLEKIVKVNIFLDDVNDFAEVNEVYAEFFGDHKPARSCVEVGKLPKGGLLEIEAIAEL